VIGFLIGGVLHSMWILIGATAIGVAAALLIQWIHENSRVKEDASIGIVFTSLFAFGVVLINWYARGTDLDPGCVLYGNIESFVLYPARQVWGAAGPMAVILAGVLVGIVAFYRYLLVCTFDPGLAVSLGMPARLIHYVFMAVLSLTVVSSFEAVGAILVVALLILPGATARLWTDRMPRMLALAAGHGVLSTLLGYWLSHPAVLDTSASAAICVAGFGLFLLSWLFAPARGLLPRLWQRRGLARRTALENLLKGLGEACRGREVCELPAGDLARAVRMSPADLDRAVKRGLSVGWLRRDDGRIVLTPAGHERCQRIMRAHRLLELYLQREFDLPDDHLHDPAEWIEHHLDEDRIRQLEGMLGVADDYAVRPHVPGAGE
jgi:manganese/zinc/iron transport system permease protein